MSPDFLPALGKALLLGALMAIPAAAYGFITGPSTAGILNSGMEGYVGLAAYGTILLGGGFVCHTR